LAREVENERRVSNADWFHGDGLTHSLLFVFCLGTDRADLWRLLAIFRDSG
jgi:hypothetical protein